MKEAGWIKLHRSVLDNPVVMKDTDHFAVWCYLLLNATHKLHDTMFGKERVTLLPGQLITGRNKIAQKTGVEPSKVKRILKTFKSAQQIDQHSERYGSLISILNWTSYQDNDQESDQRVTNERPTSDQRVTTIQECKNDKNGKNEKNLSPLKEEKETRAREDPIERIKSAGYEDPWTGEWYEIPSQEEIQRRMRGDD